MPSVRSIVLTALLTAAAFTPGTADAALNAYLKIKGQKSGDIKGSVTQKGRENMIRVLAVSHAIVSPRDAASGLPTGKRQHKPMVVTMELDRSTPLLHAALVTNETLSSVELRFWAPSLKGQAGVGAETQHYTVKLTNASISEIRTIKANDPQAPDTLEVSFTYQKIEWLWTDGGISSSDDWSGGSGKGL